MFGKKSKHPETPAKAASAAAPVRSAATVPAAAKIPGKGDGKRAYEARRAEKNGMGLDKWMAEKERRARAEREALAQSKRKTDADRQSQTAKPGLLRRLLDRAHRPI